MWKMFVNDNIFQQSSMKIFYLTSQIKLVKEEVVLFTEANFMAKMLQLKLANSAMNQR